MNFEEGLLELNDTEKLENELFFLPDDINRALTAIQTEEYMNDEHYSYAAVLGRLNAMGITRKRLAEAKITLRRFADYLAYVGGPRPSFTDKDALLEVPKTAKRRQRRRTPKKRRKSSGFIDDTNIDEKDAAAARKELDAYLLEKAKEQEKNKEQFMALLEGKELKKKQLTPAQRRGHDAHLLLDQLLEGHVEWDRFAFLLKKMIQPAPQQPVSQRRLIPTYLGPIQPQAQTQAQPQAKTPRRLVPTYLGPIQPQPQAQTQTQTKTPRRLVPTYLGPIQAQARPNQANYADIFRTH